MGGSLVFWIVGEVRECDLETDVEKYCSTESSSCSYALAPPFTSWNLFPLQEILKLRSSACAYKDISCLSTDTIGRQQHFVDIVRLLQHLHRIKDMAHTSGVPICFRVPLIPPVCTRAASLKPWPQACSIKSCISRIVGIRPVFSPTLCTSAALM